MDNVQMTAGLNKFNAEVEQKIEKVVRLYGGIAKVLADLKNMPINNASLHTAITAKPSSVIAEMQKAQYAEIEADRAAWEAKLTELDTIVTHAGMMLI